MNGTEVVSDSIIDSDALKLSPTQRQVLEVLDKFRNLGSLAYERICSETNDSQTKQGTGEWGAHRGHVSRAVYDLCSRGLVERRHTKEGENFYNIKHGLKLKQTGEPTMTPSFECDVCHQSFGDATGMNIHKTKKHPESREQPAEVKEPTEPAKEPEDVEEEDWHIDVELAEDALAKFSATVDLLRHHEECESCDLKDYLLVLLEDAVHQFFAAGLEPNNDPTVQSLKEARA
jgi:hypothetical protein